MLDKQSQADDDEFYATAVIDAYRVPWHQIDYDAHTYFASEHQHFIADPGAEMFASVQGAYRRVLDERDIDVILTGVGGDFIFGFANLPPFHLANSGLLLCGPGDGQYTTAHIHRVGTALPRLDIHAMFVALMRKGLQLQARSMPRFRSPLIKR